MPLDQAGRIKRARAAAKGSAKNRAAAIKNRTRMIQLAFKYLSGETLTKQRICAILKAKSS